VSVKNDIDTHTATNHCTIMLPQQENYQLARQLAVEGILKSDLQKRAALSGGWFESGPGGQARMGLRYLDRHLLLSFPQGTIEAEDEQERIPLREQILILHYLERARGVPLAERWISFAEIPGGAFYHPVFLKRCKSPLVKFFGENPDALKSMAAELGGEPLDLGDEGVKIQAFPFVPLALILWRGDAEFPAGGNLLFDASVSEYLPLEDIVILAETVVGKLVKRKKTGER